MTNNSGFQEDEKFMRAISFMLNFVEDENEIEELKNLLAYLVARKRIREYLVDPSIGVPYEEFHRRMVAEGVLDE